MNFVVIYLGRAFGMSKDEANAMYVAILVAVVVASAVAILPASRLSDRIGRKPLIFAACAGGAVGAAIIALTPSIPIAIVGRGAVRRRERHLPGRGLGADDRHHPEGVRRPLHGHEQRGHGLGRRRSSIAIGGIVLDLVTWAGHEALSPRVVFILAVAFFAIAAVTLRPVIEPRRDRRPAPEAAAA